MLKFPLWRMIAVVLLANTAALYLVVGNSGAPDATLQLTERELRVTNLGTDTTGMTLTLQWDRNTVMPWFDRAKLASLGFDCSTSPDAADAPDDYSTPRVLPRSAYVVFDYDPGGIPVSGQADAPQPPQSSMGGRAVDKAPAEFAPRLRPIDAGTDPRLLRARYTDRHRYLITAGTVRPTVVRANANRPARVHAIGVQWLRLGSGRDPAARRLRPSGDEDDHEHAQRQTHHQPRLHAPRQRRPWNGPVVGHGRRAG
jgi:hypothetical protein